MENQREDSKLSNDGRSATFADLFRTPNLRMKTAIISFSW